MTEDSAPQRFHDTRWTPFAEYRFPRGVLNREPMEDAHFGKDDPSPDISDDSTITRKRKKFRSAISGALIAVGVFLLKIKAIVFLLATKFRLLLVNPFEGFGLTQLGVTAGSMLVTVVAYAIKMGLAFAFGFVLITVIHEIGHAVVIRAKGLRAGAMVFIPFIGGAVTLKDQPHSAYDDAQIGLAGPIAGTLASIACLELYRLTHHHRPIYLALAFAGFLLNLFNLLPIGPLDGGRIAAAITKWMWVFGALILFWVMVSWRSPLLIFVLILSAYQIYKAIVHESNDAFYEVTALQRTSVAIVYFVLIFYLGYETVHTHARLLALQG